MGGVLGTVLTESMVNNRPWGSPEDVRVYLEEMSRNLAMDQEDLRDYIEDARP